MVRIIRQMRKQPEKYLAKQMKYYYTSIIVFNHIAKGTHYGEHA